MHQSRVTTGRRRGSGDAVNMVIVTLWGLSAVSFGVVTILLLTFQHGRHSRVCSTCSCGCSLGATPPRVRNQRAAAAEDQRAARAARALGRRSISQRQRPRLAFLHGRASTSLSSQIPGIGEMIPMVGPLLSGSFPAVVGCADRRRSAPPSPPSAMLRRKQSLLIRVRRSAWKRCHGDRLTS